MKQESLAAAVEALLSKELQTGRTIELRVKGDSLAPSLSDGDMAVVEPFHGSKPLPGEILLTQSKTDGKLELVKIAGFDAASENFLCCDAGSGLVFELSPQHVLGRATAVRKAPSRPPSPILRSRSPFGQTLCVLKYRLRSRENQIRWKVFPLKRYLRIARELRTGRSQVADILITDRCPVECKFCLYSCTRGGSEMPLETFTRIVRGYSDVGAAHLRILGGEPFAVLPHLVECHGIARSFFPPERISVVTSGYFGATEASVRKNLSPFLNLPAFGLVLSLDAFHLEKVPLSFYENILAFCRDEKNIFVTLNIHYSSGLLQALETLKNWRKAYRFDLLFSEVFELGRARELSQNDLSSEGFDDFKSALGDNRDGPDESCFRWVAFPNGDVYFCCMKLPHALAGNLEESGFEKARQAAALSYPANILRILKFLVKKPKGVKRTPCEHCPIRVQ